jgi:hypothetical protein
MRTHTRSRTPSPPPDPASPYNRKCAFDAGDYGLGFAANSLALGCDCLGVVHYWDGVVNDAKGEVGGGIGWGAGEEGDPNGNFVPFLGGHALASRALGAPPLTLPRPPPHTTPASPSSSPARYASTRRTPACCGSTWT